VYDNSTQVWHDTVMDSGRLQVTLSAMALLQNMETAIFFINFVTTKLNDVVTQKKTVSECVGTADFNTYLRTKLYHIRVSGKRSARKNGQILIPY
jgi:hypothetical protein